jgi:hypothetical protein
VFCIIKVIHTVASDVEVPGVSAVAVRDRNDVGEYLG